MFENDIKMVLRKLVARMWRLFKRF